MNEFTSSLVMVFGVYSLVAGTIVAVWSLFSRLLKKQKASFLFFALRFAKGFVGVALACAFIFGSMKYGWLSGGNSSSLMAGVFALARLTIPVFIIVYVHKITKRLEEKYEL